VLQGGNDFWGGAAAANLSCSHDSSTSETRANGAPTPTPDSHRVLTPQPVFVKVSQEHSRHFLAFGGANLHNSLMKISAPLLAVALLLIGGVAEAHSRKNALTTELVSIGRFIQLYHQQEGKYPESWNEMERITPNLDKTFSVLTPTRRMALISPPFELPQNRPGGGLVIAMTRDSYRPVGWREWPIIGTTRHLKDPVYGVVVIINGGVSRREIPPERMISILEAEGLELPEPSDLGAFPYEKGLMIGSALRLVVVVVVCSWLVRLLFQGIRTKSTSGS
jgi:hypothetical protein